MSSPPLDAHQAIRRRPLNVTVDPQLVAEARALGIPLSATVEEALRARIAIARQERWRAENADAILEANERVARGGTFGDAFRNF